MKKCVQNVKLKNQFPNLVKIQKSKDKLYCHCKSCVKEYRVLYYEKNKEKVNEKNRNIQNK